MEKAHSNEIERRSNTIELDAPVGSGYFTKVDVSCAARVARVKGTFEFEAEVKLAVFYDEVEVNDDAGTSTSLTFDIQRLLNLIGPTISSVSNLTGNIQCQNVSKSNSEVMTGKVIDAFWKARVVGNGSNIVVHMDPQKWRLLQSVPNDLRIF